MLERTTSDSAEQMEQLLRDIHYELIRLSRPELQELRMTPPRFHTLHHIVRHSPITMGELHRVMHLSKSSLTSLVDGLVADGLITRERAPDDRRRIVITPTAAGAALLERMRRSRCAHLDDALQAAGVEDTSRLVGTLHELHTTLQARLRTMQPPGESTSGGPCT